MQNTRSECSKDERRMDGAKVKTGDDSSRWYPREKLPEDREKKELEGNGLPTAVLILTGGGGLKVRFEKR